MFKFRFCGLGPRKKPDASSSAPVCAPSHERAPTNLGRNAVPLGEGSDHSLRFPEGRFQDTVLSDRRMTNPLGGVNLDFCSQRARREAD